MNIKLEDIFEFSIEKFLEIIEQLKNKINDFLFVIIFVFIFITTPFWIIPYMIVKKARGKDNE